MNAGSIALSVSILFGSIGFVEAQQLTISDIAVCNEEATQQTGGSASPDPRRGPEIARKGTDQKGTRNREKTDPSGSIITESPDPLVMGMDADKVDDPAYRTAYRDCMRQRMGKGR